MQSSGAGPAGMLSQPHKAQGGVDEEKQAEMVAAQQPRRPHLLLCLTTCVAAQSPRGGGGWRSSVPVVLHPLESVSFLWP